VSSNIISGGSGFCFSPDDVQAGDVLVAFHSADGGSNSSMTLGGAAWEEIEAVSGGTWAGTKIYKRTATSNEPFRYPVTQGSTADGTIVIAALAGAIASNIVVTFSNGTTTAPGATPANASGMQLRYAAGLTQFGNVITWSVPNGYTELDETQAGTVWTSSVLASRSYASSTSVGSATLTPSTSLYVGMAFTVLVQSSGPPPAPPAPSYPAYAPGRGSALYQYVARRLLDRSYLGHLDLTDVSFDKRILQAGSFSAAIPIPSRRVADQIAEIIPRSDAEDQIPIDRGPGVISIEVYRAGEPWGEYWITGAQIGRSRRGTPQISLRGSTLDAYWARAEVQTDLSYTNQDQIAIARALISHLQAQAGANLSIELQSGTSGVTRTIAYTAEDGGTYGQRLAELAEIDDGFEWMINLELDSGAVVRRWVWGAPKLGQEEPQHVFVDSPHGGDILEWGEEIDALRGGTRWRARGGTPTSDDDASTTSTALISAVHQATAHLAAGWPRLDQTINYPSELSQTRLEDYAAHWAAVAPGALRVDSITVALGAEPSFTPNSLGDTARIFLNNEWHIQHSRVRRIIGIGITPTSRSSGKEEAQLILEGQEVEGGG
jgi:hypothetical protein